MGSALSVCDIDAYAAEFGFSAAYCFAPLPEDGVPAETGTLVLLVRFYVPGGKLADHFYGASNTAYHAAVSMAKRIAEEKGIQTWHLPHVLLKPLCSRLPAFGRGKNTLNYLPGIGSRFCMELLGLKDRIDCSLQIPYDDTALPCGTCRACERACPGMAISDQGFDKTRCLRYYMLNGKPMPLEYRDRIGGNGGAKGIIGCDICQRVCPANIESDLLYREDDPFTLDELLLCSGDTLERFGKTYGSNYAVRNRIISQAILAAVAMNRTDLKPQICKLLDNPSATIRDHAAWAIEKMK